jgi:hypothetical protein
MRNVVRIMALGCSLLLLPACASDDPTSVEVNITGTWTTTVAACLGGGSVSACTMTLVLAQSGTTVTGTGNLTEAKQGLLGTMTITGTATANGAVKLTLFGNAFDADPDDTVQYDGTRTDAGSITGTFSSIGSITGAFTFKRQ